MQLPKVLEVKGVRVLTSQQLAEMYGTTRKLISYNFHYNKDKYVKGKHYIELVGEELKQFKSVLNFKTVQNLLVH